MLVIFFLVDLPRMVQQAVDLVPVKVPDGNDMPRNYPPGSLVRLLDVPVLITYLFFVVRIRRYKEFVLRHDCL